MFKTLRKLVGQRDVSPIEAPVLPPPPVHSLRQNFQLTDRQHEYCVGVVDRVERLYESAPRYVSQRGVDPAIAFPGNEWAGISPVRGAVFRRGYNDINFLRLMSPFAGFYLMFLDRLDVRLYAESWNEAFLASLNKEGMQDDIVEYLSSRVDPAKRLTACFDIQGNVSSCVDEQRRYTANVPQRYVVRPPRIFGEIGLEAKGVIVNPDTILCQSRINGLLCSGVLDKLERDVSRRGRVRVLEIGPGHGPLGQALMGIFGDRLEYIAVDLPTSLYNSSLYLSVLANGQGCHVMLPGEQVPEQFRFLFVANYLTDELEERLGPIDLALNTMSFPEMSEEQVRYYARWLSRILRQDGVVFDENHVNKPHHTNSKEILAEVFPFRKTAGSTLVATKNWCQDVWASTYIEDVFNCSDACLLDGRWDVSTRDGSD